MHYTLAKRAIAEAAGAAILLCAIVGSGIALANLSANGTLAGIAGSIVVGCTFVAIILSLGPISGAHFNPAVTLGDALGGNTPWREVPAYVAAQIAGALAGVAAAHLMFGHPVFAISAQARGGFAQYFSEFVAAFGLVFVIVGCVRAKSSNTHFAVAGYLAAAGWFTASGAFANPAVALARILTNTGTGIAAGDALVFCVAELAGAACAAAFFAYVLKPGRAEHLRDTPHVVGQASVATWRAA